MMSKREGLMRQGQVKVKGVSSILFDRPSAVQLNSLGLEMHERDVETTVGS